MKPGVDVVREVGLCSLVFWLACGFALSRVWRLIPRADLVSRLFKWHLGVVAGMVLNVFYVWLCAFSKFELGGAQMECRRRLSK